VRPRGRCSVYLIPPSVAHFTRTGDEFAWCSGELLDAIAAGSLTVTVSRSYPLAEAAQAHRDLQGRQTVGSIVLTP
jgi:NADPH:quinone reductase